MGGVGVKIDWSRETRSKLKLLDPDPEQMTITSYFSVVNKIDLLIKQNSKLSELLKSTQVAIHESTKVHIDLPSLFAKLMENAEKNGQKAPKSRRFTEVITKFATSLFIYSGPLAYTTLYSKKCQLLFLIFAQFREVLIKNTKLSKMANLDSKNFFNT